MTNIYRVVFFSKMSEAKAKGDGDGDVEMKDDETKLCDLLNGVELEDPDEEPRTGAPRGARRRDTRRRDMLMPSRGAIMAANRQIAAERERQAEKEQVHLQSIEDMRQARARGQLPIENPKKRKTPPNLSLHFGQPKIW